LQKLRLEHADSPLVQSPNLVPNGRKKPRCASIRRAIRDREMGGSMALAIMGTVLSESEYAKFQPSVVAMRNLSRLRRLARLRSWTKYTGPALCTSMSVLGDRTQWISHATP
jgi:hypothetical protein